VTEQRPTRTIYRSAAAAAQPAPAGAATPKRRRRLREAWWLAPVLALLVLFLVFVVAGFFLLGGVGLLQYVGITAAGKSFAGTWGSSDPGLGASVVHITRDGGGYAVSGVRLLGAPVASVRPGDDKLVANGTTGGVSWQLSLAFINRDQLRVQVTYGDGRPPLETLLTRQ